MNPVANILVTSRENDIKVGAVQQSVSISAFLFVGRGSSGSSGQSLYDDSINSLRGASDSLEAAAIGGGFKIIVIDDSASQWLFKTGSADPGDPDGQVDSLIDPTGFWAKVGGL